MTVLLQVSDTHFGTERAGAVEALVRLAHSERPDLLVFSGDITQRATAAEFAAARAFVDRLAIPRCVVIPGNHDIPLYHLPLRLFAPYRRFGRSFGPALEHEVDSPDLLLLALNTTRRWRHVDGELSRRQIDTVAQRLARADPRQLRIVVTHQPLAVSRRQDEQDLLHGHARAVRRWAEAGADLVIGGHIHLPFLWPLHRHQRGLTRSLWALNAGTAVSSRVRHEAGNSVNLLRIAPPGALTTADRSCEVERWDYREADQAFMPVDVQRLQFDDGPVSA